MIYATASDLAARLGRELTPVEVVRADALLLDASALIDAYAGSRGVQVDPVAARGIACQVVLRVFDVPSGVTQEAVGGVSRSYVTASGMTLTDAERHVLGGPVGVRSVPMTHTHDWSDAWLVP